MHCCAESIEDTSPCEVGRMWAMTLNVRFSPVLGESQERNNQEEKLHKKELYSTPTALPRCFASLSLSFLLYLSASVLPIRMVL
jgi:hypothetical protein